MAKNVKKLEYMSSKKSATCGYEIHRLFIDDKTIFAAEQNKEGINVREGHSGEFHILDQNLNYSSAKDVVLDYAEGLIKEYRLNEYSLFNGNRLIASREMRVGETLYNVILGRNLADQLKIRRIQKGDSAAAKELHNALCERYLFKPKRSLP